MPNTASVLIPHVDVGAPPSEFTNYEVTTVEVRFHEFEDLPTTRDTIAFLLQLAIAQLSCQHQ